MLKFLSTTAALLTLALVSQAQNYRADGKGTFSVDNSSLKLVAGGVSFSNDGTFVLEVRASDRTTIKVSGRWSGRGNDRQVTVTSGPGNKKSTGGGTIVVDRGLTSAVIRGTLNGDNSAFTIRFEGTGNQKSNADDNRGSSNSSSGGFSFDGSAVGTGKFKLGRDTNPVNRIGLIMSRDGKAKLAVHFKDNTTVMFTGKWSKSSDTSFKFSFPEVSGAKSATVSGDVRIKRSKIVSVNLNGRLDGSALSVSFDAN